MYKKAAVVIFLVLVVLSFASCKEDKIPEYKYESTLEIITTSGIATDEQNSIANTDIASSLEAAETYMKALQDVNVLGVVIKELEMDITVESLQERLSVTKASNDSLIVEIVILGDDKEENENIIEKTIEITNKEYPNTIVSRLTAISHKALEKE